LTGLTLVSLVVEQQQDAHTVIRAHPPDAILVFFVPPCTQPMPVCFGVH
jgi:hypothetical protein